MAHEEKKLAAFLFFPVRDRHRFIKFRRSLPVKGSSALKVEADIDLPAFSVATLFTVVWLLVAFFG